MGRFDVLIIGGGVVGSAIAKRAYKISAPDRCAGKESGCLL